MKIQNKIFKRIGITMIVLLLLSLSAYILSTKIGHQEESPVMQEEEPSLYCGVTSQIYDDNLQLDLVLPVFVPEEKPETIPEESVYTFLQGPKAWEKKAPWSGSWCHEYLSGNYFGSFGCGMCCMANIYSTLSGYECSPLDMYYFAREVSGYAPNSRVGAIGWGDLKTTLKKAGCPCDVYNKPETYEKFQEQIANSQSGIMLVTSNEDDTFWKETNGHYVNIWLYNEETDMVFLAEPGSPTNNRSWIPLRYVYDALKTISNYQYLLVDEYNEDENEWKYSGIDVEWTVPDYYSEK